MALNEENKEIENSGAEKGAVEPVAGSTGLEQPSTANTNDQDKPTAPIASFPQPKVLEAVIDTKKTQAPGPQKFSFTTPQAIQAKQAQPSKGDLAAKTESADPNDKTRTIEHLDAQIARDEKGDKKDLSYEDYEDSAKMFLDLWEGTMTMICRAISKDTSDSAYEFPQPKRERLIRQFTKVSRKKGWVMPIEFMAGGTLLAATTQVVLKARDKRKEYMKAIKKEESNLDELTKTEKPVSDTPGGKRRPGRPSK